MGIGGSVFQLLNPEMGNSETYSSLHHSLPHQDWAHNVHGWPYWSIHAPWINFLPFLPYFPSPLPVLLGVTSKINHSNPCVSAASWETQHNAIFKGFYSWSGITDTLLSEDWTRYMNSIEHLLCAPILRATLAPSHLLLTRDQWASVKVNLKIHKERPREMKYLDLRCPCSWWQN